TPAPLPSAETVNNLPSSLKRFRFLAVKLANQQQLPSVSASGDDSVHAQLIQYVTEIQQNCIKTVTWNPFEFWINRQFQYDKLAPVALDILASPASEAYVERI